MADRSISVRVNAIVSDFQRGMGQATSDLKGFQRTAQVTGADVRQSMTTVGIAAAGAGLAIAAGLGAGAKAAIDWESSFAGVVKTVDGTEAELASLEQGLRDMTQEIPASHAELAGIAEAAGQLGIETDNILGFTRSMADLGVATNLTSEEAATMFARFANITGLPQDQIENLGSAVVDLGNNSATTEREIGEMALRIAGAGSQVGLQESEILGFAAALSSVGIEAQAGGTAISRTMIEIDKSVRQGDDRLQTFAQTAGMSAEEFQRAYEQDAAGAIVTFIEGLGGISDAGGDVFGVLEDLELQDIRVRDALLRASGAGDLFRESISRGNAAFEENTALGEEAARRYETVASQIQMAKNALVEMGIGIGEVLLPVLVSLIEGARDLVGWFNDLPGPVKTTGVVLAGVSAALLTIAGTTLILVPRIMSLVSAYNLLAGSAGRAAAAQGASAAAGAGAAAAGAGGALAGAGRMLGKGAGVAAAGAIGIGVGSALAEPITGKPGGFVDSVKALFGDDEARATLRFGEAVHEINSALSEGRDPALAFQNALGHLALSGDLTTAQFESLAATAGVTITDMDAWAESMVDMARDAGFSEEAIDTLVSAMPGLSGELEASGSSAGEFEVAMDGAADSADDFAESTVDAAAANAELIASMNEALNPISAAIGAVNRLQEAEAALQAVEEDSEATTDDVAAAQWAYVESLFAAQGALDQISGENLEQALDGIAVALGISRDEAIDLLNQLDLLDGKSVTSVVNMHTIHRTTDTATGSSGDRQAVSGRFAGGPMAAGQVYEVGERNQPEMFSDGGRLFMVPGNSGRMWSNQDTKELVTALGGMQQGGGSSVTINQYSPQGERVENGTRRALSSAAFLRAS